MKKCGYFFLILFFSTVMIGSVKTAAAPASYYEGKLVTIIVGYAAGGMYDRIARVLAKHLPNHIPGKPSVIVQNMPGGSSMIATNHLSNKADPDGLTILATSRGIVFMQMLKVEGIRYDVNKMPWIGSASSDSILLCVRTDLPYKTIDDLLKAKKNIFLGVTGPADITTQVSHISKDYFLGPLVNFVQYRSGTEVFLAIERKEVDGVWIAYNHVKPYIERGLVRPLVRARVSLQGIEHLPVNEDLTNDPTGKAILGLMGRTGVMGTIYLAPPGTPAPVMKILRDAFDRTIKDPEVRADAQKAQLELTYVSDEECTKLVNYMFSQPPEVIKVLDKYMKF
jgi:tripartite-type tricarboxylate transporter receptor subunit TctC